MSRSFEEHVLLVPVNNVSYGPNVVCDGSRKSELDIQRRGYTDMS